MTNVTGVTSTCNIVRKLVVAQTTDTRTSKQSTNTSNIFTTKLKVLKDG